MKYSDMNEDQKEAFREYFMLVLQTKVTEEQKYTEQVYRFLILGNGAGILLLATFMGALASNDKDFSMLIIPLIKFFLGALFAALVFVPLMAVANQATTTISNQITEFFLNERDTSEIQGYGLNRFGKILVMGLFVSSASMFFWGVYQCFTILKQI